MRHVTVKRHPNPTGLSVADRELCIDFLRSLQRSVERAAHEWRLLHRKYWYEEIPPHAMTAIRERVERAAMNQLVGRQKGPGKLFAFEREIPIDDMNYVRQSLGM